MEDEPHCKKPKTEAADEGTAAAAVSVPSIAQILAECEEQWAAMCAAPSTHPLQALRDALRNKDYRRSFCKAALREMLIVNPTMTTSVMKEINLDDALVESVGCAGETHLLIVGYERMKGLDWPVMWKGDPNLLRLGDVWRRALTSGAGLDTTARSLKVCVSRDMCGVPLGKELLFAGYTGGSTLGAGSLLLLYMLLNCKASPWQLPSVRAFVLSITRIKVVAVVHESAEHRTADAWRPGLSLLATVLIVGPGAAPDN